MPSADIQLSQKFRCKRLTPTGNLHPVRKNIDSSFTLAAF